MANPPSRPHPISFREYQNFVEETMIYSKDTMALIYRALKLAGESGEIADKIGKLWRNHGITSGKKVDSKDRHQLKLELGDALWYIVALAIELDFSLEDVALGNITKLTDRLERGVICSEGDNR